VPETNATSYIDFVSDRTRTRGTYGAHVRGYDSRHTDLNHSAILPTKYRLWRQPYRIADVLETNATSYIDFVSDSTRTRGAYGAHVRGHDSQRSGLNHSAILLSKYRLWRQSYRIADVLATNVMSCINFVNDKTRTRGPYGAYVRGYDSRRYGLGHSAILS
jgi:hypothetical protein